MNEVDNSEVIDGGHLLFIRGCEGFIPGFVKTRLFQIGINQSLFSFLTKTNRYFYPWIEEGLSTAERKPGRPIIQYQACPYSSCYFVG